MSFCHPLKCATPHSIYLLVNATMFYLFIVLYFHRKFIEVTTRICIHTAALLLKVHIMAYRCRRRRRPNLMSYCDNNAVKIMRKNRSRPAPAALANGRYVTRIPLLTHAVPTVGCVRPALHSLLSLIPAGVS